MQSRLRLHLGARIILALFSFSFFGLAAATGVRAQAAASFPKSWNDAVSQLADNVAAAVSASTPLTLEVKNISALDGSDANRIETAFQNQLQQRSLNVVSPGSSPGRSAVLLRLTLSESPGDYLWVIQIFNNPRDPNSFSSAIVSVSKATASANVGDRPFLSLGQRLVWKQSGKFLDFAIVKDSAVGDAALLILETGRLDVYKLSGPAWVLLREIPISPPPSPSRAPDGMIDAERNSVYVSDIACIGVPSLTDGLTCDRIKLDPATATQADVPGRPSTLGDVLPGACRDGRMRLYSGEGDWTQRDLIQGYLPNSTAPGPPQTLSGNALEFDGPVMSLEADSETSAGRAVVHNLKTGNYEGYIVTATCSH